MRVRLLGAAALVLILAGAGRAAQQPVGGWLVYGHDPARSSATTTWLSPPSVRAAWYTPVSGRISSQALVAEGVPAPGRRTVYVATNTGVVYALSENGYARWRVELGQLDRLCPQIDGYGVTGTPAIDPETNAIYVADAFGRVHALDLLTGAEHAGWPVRLYADFRRELVWGALTIVGGAVYLGTGAYCDRPMEGKVFRVDLQTLEVKRWRVVPRTLGGGGGVWGWGGIAYSSTRNSLYVATGNAFRGGANRGRRFREWAGYGEHIVELGLDLSVRSANHPKTIRAPLDLDFVGSPVLFLHRTCGELAAALNKNGSLYVWRSSRLARGPVSTLHVARTTIAAPLLTQPAYSPRTGALYVSTPRQLVRIDVDRRCRARVTWSRRLGNGFFNASPTVAGDAVWLVENAIAGSTLLGFNARTGALRFHSALAGPAYVAPTVVGDRLYVPTYVGGVQGFALASGLARFVGSDESALPEHRSFADELHGWTSREDGVYATDDGAQTWRLIYPHSAVRLVRTSALAGILATGDRVSRCGCRLLRFWTSDAGEHWHATRDAAGEGFVGAAGTLWWWRGDALYRARAWPPGRHGLRGRLVARRPGAIADVDPVPNGVVALLTHRVRGAGLDLSPRVLLVQGRRVRLLKLPRVGGDVLVRSLEAAWPALTVRGFDVTGFTRNQRGDVIWRTLDGGGTWSIERQ